MKSKRFVLQLHVVMEFHCYNNNNKDTVLRYAIQFKILFFLLFIVIFLLYINGSVKRRKCLFLTVSGRHVTMELWLVMFLCALNGMMELGKHFYGIYSRYKRLFRFIRTSHFNVDLNFMSFCIAISYRRMLHLTHQLSIRVYRFSHDHEVLINALPKTIKILKYFLLFIKSYFNLIAKRFCAFHSSNATMNRFFFVVHLSTVKSVYIYLLSTDKKQTNKWKSLGALAYCKWTDFFLWNPTVKLLIFVYIYSHI